MSLLAVGINHKTAPIEVRERLSFSKEGTASALHDLKRDLQISEAVLLSTCNRTEIYCANMQANRLIGWWQDYHKGFKQPLCPYLYIHQDHKVPEHLMRVSSGLDSMVLGEPQILGQMKAAYAESTALGFAGKMMSRLFQSSFSVAKSVRTQTDISKEPVSVAYAATRLARQIFSNVNESQICLVGAGQTSELVAKYLISQGATNLHYLNRTYSRAQKLAAELPGEAHPWSDLPTVLNGSDIVISSTSASEPIIGYDLMRGVLKARRHKPVLMIDLAVPRDIETRVQELEDVFLYSVDDLEGIIDDNLDKRGKAIGQAEQIISDGSDQFMQWYRSQSALGIVLQWRNQVESIREDSLGQALRSIDAGNDPKAVLKGLAYDLTNKWMHKPTMQLKEAILKEDTRTLDQICELFEVTSKE